MPALVGVSPALLHAGVLPHCFALTLPCLPTRCGVGAKVFARVGLHLLWACLLAGGWGLVFALLPVFVWVFACLLVCACLGLWGSVVPPPLCPGLLSWCSRLWCGRCWRVRGWRVRGGRVGGLVGAGQSCPAPYCVACGARLLRARGEGRWEGEGSHRPVQVLAWLGAVVVLAYHVGDKCPKPGESKIGTTGAGAIVRSRPWWWFWWWGRVVVGWVCFWWWVLLPLGARGGSGGVALSP